MPVARNTWQPSLILKPDSAVRRRTIRYASTRFIGLSVRTPVLPAADRKRGVLPSSRIPAAARYSLARACDAPASRGAYRLSRAAAPTSVYRPGNSLRTRMATTAPMHHRHQRTVAQAHQPSPNSGRRDPKATGGLAEALASRGRRLSWLLSGLLLRRHSHYHRLHHLEIRFPKMVFDDLHRTGAGEAVNCRMIN